MAAASAPVAGAGPASAPTGGCLVLAPLVVAQAPKPSDELQAQKSRQKPITRQEALELIRALEPVDLPDGSGKVIRSVKDRGRLDATRFRTLLEDATLLLLEIQTRDLLSRIDEFRGLDPPRRLELEGRYRHALGAFDECAQLRFAERGGLAALESSRAIVEGLQDELAGAILPYIGGERPGLAPEWLQP